MSTRDHAPVQSTQDRLMSVLAAVLDPEIPAVSIVDLGIVRGILDEPATVQLTPTYTGCPAATAIRRAVRDALDAHGFGAVRIETVLSPPWTTDWITDAGRARLLAYGIAPPPKGQPASGLAPPQELLCPRCRSGDTVEVSHFGSTPCKAQWRCRACLEPFEHFKCF